MGGYYYLVSSLPMLFNEAAPPLTMQEFSEACGEQLSEKDMAILEKITLVPIAEQRFPDNSAAEGWRRWEITLRNRIAVQRAPHGKDISEYVLYEDDIFSEIEVGVQEAFALKNPLERERFFDKMRWQQLDNLEACHDFDLDRLCVYKIKLMILEKWEPRTSDKGKSNLDTALDRIDSNYSRGTKTEQE
ncbi:DUF2764 family protein [Lentisphaerota bacterium ZTH]|nr:DUF2764 family protein [Lentisphaerota bacterium]WET06134.1 DUF2764 family protein [Lentisphaerota bacterium ZTH]